MTGPLLRAALVVVAVATLLGVPTAHAAEPPPSPVQVASANVREGSLVRHRADTRDGTDRRRFAERLLGRGTKLPDVVLLQEVLGTAGHVAAALNAHPRAKRLGVRYRTTAATWAQTVTGRRDGRRDGRFRLLRSSAILVNAKTVTRVNGLGAVRTWGRWHRHAWARTGRHGHGCTSHPWVRVTVRHPGTTARQALVSNVHLAPVGIGLKTRAAAVLRNDLGARHRQRPQAVAVLGGDFNANRCRQPHSHGERLACPVRSLHRSLLDAGYRDVVRRAQPSGPTGVAGVARRIDFLYTRGAVRAGWFDRCYRAHLVRWTFCGDRAVFGTRTGFLQCERRSLHHGRAGDGCPAPRFRRYYSDHPVLTGTVG